MALIVSVIQRADKGMPLQRAVDVIFGADVGAGIDQNLVKLAIKVVFNDEDAIMLGNELLDAG